MELQAARDKSQYATASDAEDYMLPSNPPEMVEAFEAACGALGVDLVDAAIPNTSERYAEFNRKERADRAPIDPPGLDTVNHPKHYNSSPARCQCGRPIECIDVVRHMKFNPGNVVKYVWRAGLKGSLIEDMKKALWYLQDEIARLEKGET